MSKNPPPPGTPAAKINKRPLPPDTPPVGVRVRPQGPPPLRPQGTPPPERPPVTPPTSRPVPVPPRIPLDQPFVNKSTHMGHCGGISCVKYSPCGRYLATGSADKRVRIWSAVTTEFIVRLEGHTEGINDLAWSPNTKRGCRLIVTASDEKDLRVWSTTTWTQARLLSGHTTVVTCVNFRHDGQRIVTGSADETLRIWTTKNTTCWKEILAHYSVVTAVGYNPDGTLIVSSSFDGSCLIWDAERCRLLRRIVDDETMPVSFCKFLPGGNLVLVATLNSTLNAWRVDTGELKNTYKGHVNNKYCLVATEMKDRYIVSGSEDNRIYIWDSTSGALIQRLEGHKDAVIAFSVHPLEPKLASGGLDKDKSVKIWEARDGEV